MSELEWSGPEGEPVRGSLCSAMSEAPAPGVLLVPDGAEGADTADFF